MRTPGIILAFLVLLGVMACTVGPDYEAPEIEPPPRFVLQDVLSDLNQGRGEEGFPAEWWEGFGDPLLNRLVEAGLADNFGIASTAARLERARARLKLAGAGDEPTVVADLDGDVERERELGTSEDPTTDREVFGTVGVAVPLDVFGRTARNVEAARAGVEAARSELRGIVLDVSAEVTAEYLRLRGNQRRLELLEESVALREKTLSIVSIRFGTGLAPELDVRRAETSVEKLRADIPPLKEALVNSRNRLATLTGNYPGVYENLLRDAADIPVYGGRIPDWVPLDVLTRRPDVHQAEAELKRAVALIGVAEAEYYPAFQIASEISIGASGVTGTPTVGLLIGSLSALISQVVTDGGEREANLAIARANAEEALADYRQVLLDVCREVEASLAAIEASRASQESLEKAVRSSSRSFNQAETLYQQGLISFLDVVDAQRVLAEAEQDLAAERTHYATQIAELFRVLGTEVREQRSEGGNQKAEI